MKTNAARVLERLGIPHEIRTYPVISVSAGVRGAQLLLAPADYARATKATVADIARPVGG
jgi:Cys-tRNA(Pro)/Cys-tRNA(Cys) deacylase